MKMESFNLNKIVELAKLDIDKIVKIWTLQVAHDWKIEESQYILTLAHQTIYLLLKKMLY